MSNICLRNWVQCVCGNFSFSHVFYLFVCLSACFIKWNIICCYRILYLPLKYSPMEKSVPFEIFKSKFGVRMVVSFRIENTKSEKCMEASPFVGFWASSCTLPTLVMKSWSSKSLEENKHYLNVTVPSYPWGSVLEHHEYQTQWLLTYSQEMHGICKQPIQYAHSWILRKQSQKKLFIFNRNVVFQTFTIADGLNSCTWISSVLALWETHSNTRNISESNLIEGNQRVPGGKEDVCALIFKVWSWILSK